METFLWGLVGGIIIALLVVIKYLIDAQNQSRSRRYDDDYYGGTGSWLFPVVLIVLLIGGIVFFRNSGMMRPESIPSLMSVSTNPLLADGDTLPPRPPARVQTNDPQYIILNPGYRYQEEAYREKGKLPYFPLEIIQDTRGYYYIVVGPFPGKELTVEYLHKHRITRYQINALQNTYFWNARTQRFEVRNKKE